MTGVLGQVGSVGPYFAVRVGGPDDVPPDGFLPLSSLYAAQADGLLGRRIGAAAQRLRTPELRVAASILHLGLAARLWSVTLGAAALGRLVPDLDPAHVHYRWPATGPLDLWLPGTAPDGPGRTAPVDDADLADAVHRSVIEQNLVPLHAAVRAVVPVAEGLLWGNAASALAGALQVLRTQIAPGRPDAAATALRVTQALLAAAPLLGTGTLTVDRTRPPSPAGLGARSAAATLRFRRRSCCLYYRVPGGGICGDCVFETDPPRRNEPDRSSDSS